MPMPYPIELMIFPALPAIPVVVFHTKDPAPFNRPIPVSNGPSIIASDGRSTSSKIPDYIFEYRPKGFPMIFALPIIEKICLVIIPVYFD
jgi:hypothetical protein